MEDTFRYYNFFDFIIRSRIELPELVKSSSTSALFSFSLSSTPPSNLKEPTWSHHWHLPNGEISISFARAGNNFHLRFPHLADFVFSKTDFQINCHRYTTTPHETVRHLLLDQVLPRIVSYLGRPVIHASGSVIDTYGILFLGQTGWGKSTLGAHFHQSGCALLTDDCILVERDKENVTGIPSYAGMRLLEDSLNALDIAPHAETCIQKVAHYSSKKRVIIKGKTPEPPIPITIRAVFVLNDPVTESKKDKVAFSPLTGAFAAIELVKHCFHLDLSDSKVMGEQLKTLTRLCGSRNLSIYNMEYPRNHHFLPEIRQEIISLVSSLT